MSSKYELTISTDYVNNWSYVDAVRELFQNAIDNEIVAPENTMYFGYNNSKLIIGNKTSVLTLNSLLLGSSTKREDNTTIGKHGEGYKIAFMVLLREGKNVTVYNYGAKEIWRTKLVKSRRFGNQLVPCIFIEKVPIWDKIPSHDLMIEIEDVTVEEYNKIVDSNLHLQNDYNYIEATKSFVNGCKVLLDEKHKGKIFVKGLFVMESKSIQYGYDFTPQIITLDRDRKMIDTFNLLWNTSSVWGSIPDDNFPIIAKLILNDVSDVRYISNLSYLPDLKVVAKEVLNTYCEKYPDTIPVSTNEQLQDVILSGKVPHMVSDNIRALLSMEDVDGKFNVEKSSLSVLFSEWFDTIKEKLNDEEIEKGTSILNRLKEQGN